MVPLYEHLHIASTVGGLVPTVPLVAFIGLALRGNNTYYYRVSLRKDTLPTAIGRKEQMPLFRPKKKLDSSSIDAFSIVADYGVALETVSKLGGTAHPDYLLPFAKDEIKAAFAQILTTLRTSGRLTAEVINHMSVGYASLAMFIKPDNAKIIGNYDAWARKAASVNPMDPQASELLTAPIDDRVPQIQDEIVKETQRLNQEFRRFLEPDR